MTATDEELLKRIAAGDQDAYLMLYDRFAPRVYGLIVKVMGAPQRTNGGEAEDVLQDVMWEVWNRANRYDASLGSVTTWLLMMARSRAIDAIRKRRAAAQAVQRHAESSQPRDLARPGDDDPTASLTIGADLRLRAALEELPAEQRTVIAMAFLRGLTREQIGEALGIPVGTVKTRIRLGVKRLTEMQSTHGFAAL